MVESCHGMMTMNLQNIQDEESMETQRQGAHGVENRLILELDVVLEDHSIDTIVPILAAQQEISMSMAHVQV